MRRTLSHLWTGTRWCTASVFSFVLWSAWLALAILLAAQLYVATHRELKVPGFLLRSLEERLAASGIRATFGRTSFDPTGRVLIENARLSLPAFAEPVVSARAVYVRLDPWALAAGQFEPRELRISGASLAVPAMLSPSGRSEEILRDLDATLVPHAQELELAQLSARIAGLSLIAHGALALPPRPLGDTGSLPIADFLARHYPALCRQLVAASAQLAVLDQPSLRLELAPSPSRVAIAHVTLFARGLKLALPQPVQASGLHLVTKIPLLGDAPVTARLELTADSLTLPFDAGARRVHARLRGTLRPALLQFAPLELDLSAGSFSAAGFSTGPVTVRLHPGPLPHLSADVAALLLDAPLALHAEADLAAQAATLRFDGALSPAILTPLSAYLRVDVRKYFDFAALDRAVGHARLGPGWKFETLAARVAFRGINAYRVTLDEGRAVFHFDGRHFSASEAAARIGDNFAHGTFAQDLQTLDYRFLLEGRLRPLAISGWFREWWPNFFHQLAFPVAAPAASVEVAGRWTDPRRSFIYVFADSAHPVIRGAALDHVRSRLIIRPGSFDGPELYATHPTGTVRGTFRYVVNPAPASPSAWGALDLDLASTLDPSVAVTMLGPLGESIFAPFKWSAPPALTLSGRIEGGAHTTLHIDGRTTGEFRFQDFPLENVRFTADVRDNDVDVTQMEARFGEGTLTGRAKVSGTGADRRVAFDYTLKDASLVRAVATLQDYTARKNRTPPSPPGKFLQEKASVHLDLSAAAEGRYDDPLSYHGTGRASLQGPGLGEVQLLGLLSELLKFTALRFTSAKTTFKIDGAKLTFPDLAIRGANSAIDAHGDFALDRRALDIKAKLFPFQESGNPLKSLVGAVLTPFSNIFEVKLTGTLDRPEWAFVVGPTNFLRSLAPGETAPDPAKAAPPLTPGQPPPAPPSPPPPAAPVDPAASPAAPTPPKP
jgi:hypothetical protein